jgi:hypothetical protein
MKTSGVAGLVWPMDEKCVRRVELDEKTWNNAQDVAEYVLAHDLMHQFMWDGVMRGDGGEFWITHASHFRTWMTERKRESKFLPSWKEFMGRIEMEFHSVGLVVKEADNRDMELLKKETESLEFKVFAAALSARFVTMPWLVSNSNRCHEVVLCSMMPLVYEIVPNNRIEMHEVFISLPFRERYGWFANHCEKQLRFFETAAMRVKNNPIKTRVLYLGPDREWGKENFVNVDALGLTYNHRRKLEGILNGRRGWKKLDTFKYRRQSVIVMIKDNYHMIGIEDSKVDFSAALTEENRWSECFDALRKRGENITKIDLSDNLLVWESSKEHLSSLKELLHNQKQSCHIILAGNNLYGEEFAGWMKNVLESDNIYLDISGCLMALGWTQNAWNILPVKTLKKITFLRPDQTKQWKNWFTEEQIIMVLQNDVNGKRFAEFERVRNSYRLAVSSRLEAKNGDANDKEVLYFDGCAKEEWTPVIDRGEKATSNKESTEIH